jgi:predicted small integral membrane protein
MIYLVYFAVPIVLLVGMLVALVTDPGVRWRLRARRFEEKRGIALLTSWLTPRQAEQWVRLGAFEVVGCDTGKRYRITRGTAMNIHELDANGCTTAQWCFAPEGKFAGTSKNSDFRRIMRI